MDYWFSGSHEMFPPSELLAQAQAVCVQNMSGADPLGTIRIYGEEVLPALRGARV
jgi:hypothetical protein